MESGPSACTAGKSFSSLSLTEIRKALHCRNFEWPTLSQLWICQLQRSVMARGWRIARRA